MIEPLTIDPETGNVSMIGPIGIDGIMAIVVADCNENGMSDELEPDCNGNGIPDECDIVGGMSSDKNENGVPDECECPGDIDGDGEVGILDFLTLLGNWGPCP